MLPKCGCGFLGGGLYYDDPPYKIRSPLGKPLPGTTGEEIRMEGENRTFSLYISLLEKKISESKNKDISTCFELARKESSRYNYESAKRFIRAIVEIYAKNYAKSWAFNKIMQFGEDHSGRNTNKNELVSRINILEEQVAELLKLTRNR
jgi:hypothetical protein